MSRILNGPLATVETRPSNVSTATADVGDGDGSAEAVGSGEAVGGADGIAAVGEADGIAHDAQPEQSQPYVFSNSEHV